MKTPTPEYHVYCVMCPSTFAATADTLDELVELVKVHIKEVEESREEHHEPHRDKYPHSPEEILDSGLFAWTISGLAPFYKLRKTCAIIGSGVPPVKGKTSAPEQVISPITK